MMRYDDYSIFVYSFQRIIKHALQRSTITSAERPAHQHSETYVSRHHVITDEKERNICTGKPLFRICSASSASLWRKLRSKLRLWCIFCGIGATLLHLLFGTNVSQKSCASAASLRLLFASSGANDGAQLYKFCHAYWMAIGLYYGGDYFLVCGVWYR